MPQILPLRPGRILLRQQCCIQLVLGLRFLSLISALASVGALIVYAPGNVLTVLVALDRDGFQIYTRRCLIFVVESFLRFHE